MLSTLSTDVVISDKIQETKTINHINCIKKYYKKNLKININQKEYLNHNCSLNTLDSLFQELYKRFIVPLYIPILVLTSMLLITFSKENKSYHKNRILIFFTGLSLIIISETLLKFIKNDFYFNFKIIILPLIIFILIYIFCKLTLKKNLKKII